ncbi:MAG: HNH endonuclease signature motif containing protein [Bacteroidaceae bacterium]
MPTLYKPKKNKPSEGNTYNDDRRKIYTSTRWRKLRAWKLANNPLCEMCEAKGIVRPAEDIHHITSFMSTYNEDQRKFLAYDYDNLMSLCKRCHQKIHNCPTL